MFVEDFSFWGGIAQIEGSVCWGRGGWVAGDASCFSSTVILCGNTFMCDLCCSVCWV